MNVKKDMMNHVLQWTGTAFLLGMYVVMNFFHTLHPLEIILGLCGGACYFAWSVRVKNKPQIIVNLAGISVCIAGLFSYFG
jgi:hypothetical protein